MEWNETKTKQNKNENREKKQGSELLMISCFTIIMNEVNKMNKK